MPDNSRTAPSSVSRSNSRRAPRSRAYAALGRARRRDAIIGEQHFDHPRRALGAQLRRGVEKFLRLARQGGGEIHRLARRKR